ncbi:MAG: hypothetical protein ACSLE6_11100, partial [Mycobacterium sp.]
LALVGGLDDPHVRVDVTSAGVAHEQLGPLPPRWRDRVRLCPIRCGRRTLTGAPCRRVVAGPGPCASHGEKATTDAERDS